MAGTIPNTHSRFLHAEIPSLIHSPLKQTVYKGVGDCVISAFVSGAGACVLHYFPSDPIACVLGRFMQVAGQVSLVWSLGVATSALLEKSFSDECLGKSAKGAVVVAKYALPLLVGLGLSIAFHLPAFAVVLTEVYIGTFAIQYRGEVQKNRIPPAPSVSGPSLNSSPSAAPVPLSSPLSTSSSASAASSRRRPPDTRGLGPPARTAGAGRAA